MKRLTDYQRNKDVQAPHQSLRRDAGQAASGDLATAERVAGIIQERTESLLRGLSSG